MVRTRLAGWWEMLTAREQFGKEEGSTEEMKFAFTRGDMTIGTAGAVVGCKKTFWEQEIYKIPTAHSKVKLPSTLGHKWQQNCSSPSDWMENPRKGLNLCLACTDSGMCLCLPAVGQTSQSYWTRIKGEKMKALWKSPSGRPAPVCKFSHNGKASEWDASADRKGLRNV